MSAPRAESRMSAPRDGADMSGPPIDTAMVLAAGLGTRMRPLTDDRPKALVEVDGKPLIDHAITRLRAAGIARIVVNVHAFAGKLRAHLAARWGGDIIISDETDALLDTGGAIKRALPLLGAGPVIIHNCDSLWVEGMGSSLARLMAAWDPARMDALLLVAPTASIVGDVDRGDFTMDALGRLAWRAPACVAPFMYTGVQIINPAPWAAVEAEAFSTAQIWKQLIEAQRAYGLRHDGTWMHVGTPGAVAEAEAFLRKLKGLPVRQAEACDSR